MLRLGVLVLLVSLCHATLHIPLVKHEKLLSANAYREFIERRHGGVQIGEMSSIPLMHYKFVQYYGNISIGTPKQNFSVAFDTAVTSIWVPSTDCPHGEFDFRNKFCKNHTLFDIKASNSSQFPKDKKDTVDCGYRDYPETKCRDGTDIVCARSLCAKQQSIQAATAVPKEYDQFYFDGVVGMGFVANITDQKDLPWFYNVMQQNKLPYPIFTLYLNSKGPELIIGDVNYTLFTGDFIFAPVNTTAGNHWQFHAEMLEVRNSSASAIASTCASQNGCSIKLDSGMPYIAGPPKDIEGLQNFIGAKLDKSGDYVIDCDKKQTAPIAVLRVLGAEVIMTGEDYILEVENGKCITAFMAAKMNDWMFGDVFFAAYYTMFDVNLNRVGFAKAR